MSQLRRNAVIYSIGATLPKIGAFLLLPVLTRYLTPTEYGIVNAMLIVGSIAGIAFTLSIDRSLWRLYHDYPPSERGELVGTMIMSVTAIATVLLLLALASRGLLQLLFPTIPFQPYYVYALLAAYFGIFGAVPQIQLQIQGKAAQFVMLGASEFLLTNGLVLYFVLGGEGAAGMLRAQMLGAAVFGAVYLLIGLRTARLRFRFDMFKASLAFSVPLIPSQLFAWILNLSDRVFLNRYRSLAEVGTYSAGYRVGSASSTVTGAFYQAYNPRFYELANSADQVSAKRNIARLNTAYLAVTVLTGFSIAFLAPEAVGILFPKSYSGITGIIQVVALGYIVSQAQGLLHLQIYQSKNTAGLMWVYALGAAVNIGLNFALVPRYGSTAAAWTTTVSFTVMFCAAYLYARRGYFVPFAWREIGIWAVLTVVLFTVAAQVVSLGPVVSIVVKGILLCIVALAAEARYHLIGASFKRRR